MQNDAGTQASTQDKNLGLRQTSAARVRSSSPMRSTATLLCILTCLPVESETACTHFLSCLSKHESSRSTLSYGGKRYCAIPLVADGKSPTSECPFISQATFEGNAIERCIQDIKFIDASTSTVNHMRLCKWAFSPTTWVEFIRRFILAFAEKHEVHTGGSA